MGINKLLDEAKSHFGELAKKAGLPIDPLAQEQLNGILARRSRDMEEAGWGLEELRESIESFFANAQTHSMRRRVKRGIILRADIKHARKFCERPGPG